MPKGKVSLESDLDTITNLTQQVIDARMQKEATDLINKQLENQIDELRI